MGDPAAALELHTAVAASWGAYGFPLETALCRSAPPGASCGSAVRPRPSHARRGPAHLRGARRDALPRRPRSRGARHSPAEGRRRLTCGRRRRCAPGTARCVPAWVAEDLRRRTLLRDHAFVQEAHPVAMSRANPISWVAISIVMPAGRELTDHVEHLGDELGVERARDLVEQHDVGLHRQRAHDRDPLLLAADSRSGYSSAFSARPKRSSSSRARASACAPGMPTTFVGASVMLRITRHVREEVERLEHDADAPRIAFTSTPGAVISSPSTTIVRRRSAPSGSRIAARSTCPTRRRRSGRSPRGRPPRGRRPAAPGARRRTCAAPRSRSRPFAHHSTARLTPPAVARDQPVDEPGLRDRDHEIHQSASATNGV